MTAAVLSHHVTAYAAQVRAHLADLTREQLDDLTDGLEADLMEALEDPARPITGEIPLAGPAGAPNATASLPEAATTSIIDLTERFGTPKAYAEELRTAAGLPAPREGKGAASVRPPLAERIRTRLAARRARLVARPWWPAARAIGEALRPLWWVARGWVLFNIVVSMVSGVEDVFFLPRNVFGLMLLLLAVAASIQHGQGHWTLTGRGRHVFAVVSLIAAVGMIPTLMTASAHADRVTYVDGPYYEPEPVADGVYFGGLPVTNLFVYDADGEFIDQAQIVDDKGRPVRVDRPGGLWDDSDGTSRYWSPAQDSYGRDVWNAFPLRMWSDRDAEWNNQTQEWVLPEGVIPASVPPPFVQLAPLATDQGAPSGQPVEPGTETATDAPVDPAAPTDPAPADSAPADTAPSEPPRPSQEPGAPAAPTTVEAPPAG